MRAWPIVSFILTLSLLLSACTASSQADQAESSTATPAFTTAPSGRLVIYSGRSEPLIQPVIAAFQAKYPAVEALLKAGSNSEIANALIEEQANPQADLFITTELFTAQALADQGIFQSYQPAGAESLPDGLRDAQDRWTGLTRRARVILYNTGLVSPEEVPTSIFDLADPKWKGQVAAAGSTNGSMQAQIAAMRLLVGEQATEEWLQGLIENEVVFFGGHTDVRKAVGAGEFKLGLVNHYYYHLQLAEGSPVGVVYPDQDQGQVGLITNATAAALVQGASNPDAAKAFLDFLISPEGQNLFASLNFEYPLLPGVPLSQDIQPLESFRLAEVDVAQAANDYLATFDLMEKVSLP